jgi:hypothetical protein
MINAFLKKIVRANICLEILSYIVQNNLLSNALNFSGDGNFDKTVDGLTNHGYKISQQYLEAVNFSVEGKTILELGCGLSLSSACYLIKNGHAKHIFVYDKFDCRHPLDYEAIEKAGLIDCLRHITYFAGDYELIGSAIKPLSIDVVLSNAVLEHVENLEHLFDVVMEKINTNGLMYHRVDLRCHNRFRKHGELYFHKFSNNFWRIMGNKIGQPNRWLLKDFSQLFLKYGLSPNYFNIKYFPSSAIEGAEKYLKGKDLRDYSVAVFDVILRVKN